MGEMQTEAKGPAGVNVSWDSLGLEFALDHPQMPSVFRALWEKAPGIPAFRGRAEQRSACDKKDTCSSEACL